MVGKAAAVQSLNDMGHISAGSEMAGCSSVKVDADEVVVGLCQSDSAACGSLDTHAHMDSVSL